MIFSYSNMQSFTRAIISGLVSGIIFGLLMSISIGIISFFYKKYTSTFLFSKNKVHQAEEITVNIPIDKAFEICIKSITQINKGKIIKLDKTDRIIEGRAGMSWKSTGEKININLYKNNNNLTLIRISSKPLLKTTIIDLGKNLENVNTIKNYIINK